MFGCNKCRILESEVSYLRDQLSRVQDKLIALSNPQAYQAINYPMIPPEDCYGSDTDEMVEYGQNGQRILVTKKKQ